MNNRGLILYKRSINNSKVGMKISWTRRGQYAISYIIIERSPREDRERIIKEFAA